MQRHHLLPLQLLRHQGLARLFAALGDIGTRFDDFRTNGLLLPAREEAAQVLGLPLHRGPHRAYNEMVAERVGQIEAGWARASSNSPALAATHAAYRIALLQGALRRRLLDPRRRPIRLNRRDPLGQTLDFRALDAMAESLWAETRLPEPT